MLATPPSFVARCLVLLTFWLAALLPAAVMAAQAAHGDLAPWTQLCRSSVVSPRAAELRAGLTSAGESPQDHGLFQHCPFCQAHQTPWALPPGEPSPWQPPALTHAHPARFFTAPHTPHAWRTALARAPPRTV